MRVWANIYKKHKIIATAKASSDNYDVTSDLNECLERIYKELDLSEPVWVSKHARELSRFSRTKFMPADFVEPVHFDYLEIEFSTTDED